MSNIDNAVGQLITVITESEVYCEYLTQLERVKEQPGLKEQIDDFRKRNYILQTGGDADFDKIKQFEKENEDFRENPYVSDFLAAELAFCRMIQDINVRVVGAVRFE